MGEIINLKFRGKIECQTQTPQKPEVSTPAERSESAISRLAQEPEHEEPFGPDEAIEDRGIEEEIKTESEGEGEDLEENMERDYQAIPALDNYENVGIDDERQRELTMQERRKVEQKLEAEDRAKLAKKKRLPEAMFSEFDEEFSEDNELQKQLRRERLWMQQEEEMEAEEEEEAKYLDMEDPKGKISEWLRQPRTIKFVRRHFSNFLRHFKDEKNNDVYEQRIHEMCTANKQSLELTYTHLSQKMPSLAIWVAEVPNLILPVFNEVAHELVNEVFPNYDQIHREIFVRIRDLPIEDKLRDLRQIHLNALIRIKGVVTKRSNVYPQLKKMVYECTKCGEKKGPFFMNAGEDLRLGQCLVCQSNGPFALDNDETVYKNYQKVTVQETPGTVPPGRVPRQKDVVLLADNVDAARPGDEVEITGIYTNRFDYNMNVQHGFPVFATCIEANYIKRVHDIESLGLTEDDMSRIRELAKRPGVSRIIANSVAPSIYGHAFIKRALALAMFGGEPKDVEGKHKVRGDINVLLLGDPATAKSQFLKYVEQTFHRSVYTTGKGASAVGLTAGVHRDPITREWTLEGGALVLADKGVCLIDEFDKMNDTDRTSIHEAMEQQSISISKAGIVTSLQARCSVIAAANPIKGRYDPQMNFLENVDLTDPILSRFDILAVVRDEVDPKMDEALATFIINSHIKSHPNARNQDLELVEGVQQTLLDDSHIRTPQDSIIPQELLKKYIIYAKKYVRPKLDATEFS